ncbi:MAG: hypothetical protein K2X29_08815 [Candidatus Obscuribacterales bacterium]|nr:hypothetical protein [Candidatus Obscuribacterales bacterium]
MSVKRILLTLLVLVMSLQAASLPGACCVFSAIQTAHCAAVVKKCCAIKPMPCCQVRQGNCNTQQQPQEDKLSTSDLLIGQLSAADLVLRQEVLSVSDIDLMRQATTTRIVLKTEKYKPDRLYILNRALLI